MTRYDGGWFRTLSSEQVATVQRIRGEHNGGRHTGSHGASHGWKVYMQPTTMPARFLELRHYMTDGRVSRWVIEQDGSVSSHNDQGTRSEMSLP